MSDTKPTADRNALANLDRAQGLDAMVLLALRLTRDLATAPALASRSLTTESYAILANLAQDAGSPVAKIGKRALPMGAELREARQALLTAGLVAEHKGAEGGKAGYALTEAGKAAILAIRAELAVKLAAVPEKSWRALSRTASLVRATSDAVAGPRAQKPAAEARPAKAPKARKPKA